jgi:membrane protein DedA with SNARE-associated domain
VGAVPIAETSRLGRARSDATGGDGYRFADMHALVLASISESLFNTAWHFVRDAGLPAIFLLTVAESACIPIPVEATMMFAGFAVANPGGSASHHHLTLLGVVVAGVLGNLVGSWIAYGVGRAGRLELIERHGRWLRLKPSHIEWADRWFGRYGDAAVFFSRMVPLVRTFISLPAGVAKMPFWRFTVLTIAGCVPFILGLALAGHAIGGEWSTVRKGFEYVDYAVLALVVIGIAYAILRRRSRGRSAGPGAPAEAGQDAEPASVE